MAMANLPPRPPGGGPPRELPPAGQRRLPDGRRPDHLWSALWANKPTRIRGDTMEHPPKKWITVQLFADIHRPLETSQSTLGFLVI